MVDFRTKDIAGKFHGVSGAVSGLEYIKSTNEIACISIDRILRTYNATGDRKLKEKVYLKQRLCSLSVHEDELLPEVIAEKSEDEEEVWSKLKTTSEPKKKRTKV
jgi:hypothetical protein